MRVSGRKRLSAVQCVTVWLCLLLGGCMDEPDSGGNARVEATFQLSSTLPMGGKINIREAYLKLDRIEIVGNAGSENTTSLIHQVAASDPPYRLTGADSSHASFDLPFFKYSQLSFQLYLYQDDHPLKFPEDPIGEAPPIDDNNTGAPGEESPGMPGEEPTPDDGGSEGEQPDGDDDYQHGDEDDEGGHDNGSQGDKDEVGDDDGDNSEDDDNADNDGGGNDADDDIDNDDDDDADDRDDDNDNGQHHNDDGEEDGDRDDDGDKDDNGKGKGKDKAKGEDRDKGPDKHNDKDKHKNKGKNRNKAGNDGRNNGHDDNDHDRRYGHDNDDGRVASRHTRVIDLDDFFQNAKPSVVIFGVYENEGQVIDVIFVVTGLEKIVLPARQNGGFAVTLSNNNAALITFDPEYLFESLTSSDVESGSLQQYQNRNVLFVHKDHNNALYEKLIARLEASANLFIASDL